MPVLVKKLLDEYGITALAQLHITLRFLLYVNVYFQQASQQLIHQYLLQNVQVMVELISFLPFLMVINTLRTDLL